MSVVSLDYFMLHQSYRCNWNGTHQHD